MKRKLVIVLCLLCLLTCGARAEGAALVSAPPGLALTAQGESPVAVERASVTLDFSGGAKDALGLSPQAQMTSAYTLVNPTGTEQTVTVAQPFAGAIEDAGLVPEVTVDGGAADCAVHYGPLLSEADLSVSSWEAFGTADGAGPQEAADGAMYTFVPVVDMDRFAEELQNRFYVRASFRSDGPIVYGGFGGVSTLEDGRLEFTAWVYPEREEWPLLTVFLPGGGTLEECEVNGYDDYIGIRTPLGVEMKLERRENVTFRDYLGQYTRAEGQTWERAYQAVLSDLKRDENGLPEQPLTEAAELLRYALDYQRLALEVFQVTLAPGERREVSVTLPLDGTVEQTEDLYTYTYTWLPGPAWVWAGFEGLELTVIPPRGMKPEAVFALTEEKGEYTFHWDGLPRGTLSLPLTQGEEDFSILSAAVLGAVILAAALAAVLLLRRKGGGGRRQNGASE